VVVVIGLGNLGFAIARRLLIRGQDVVAVDLAPDRREAWRAVTGLEARPDLDAVPWDAVDRALVVVRLTHQAEAVLEQLRDRTPGRDLGCLVVTTLEPSFARTLGRFDGAGRRIVETPVSGGELGALGGKLTVMAAGSLTDDDRTFLRTTIAQQLVVFPELGQPTLAKLLNNVAAAYNARVLAEVLLLAEGAGLDPRRFFEVLLTSSGGSWMASGFLELVDDLLDKDVALLRESLGGLPAVTLGPDDDLVGRLCEARRLLTPAPARAGA
jgi:3-hydroxyisobutyrate dehydrogenase-like beta-hydroxyacid dehydrogenase